MLHSVPSKLLLALLWAILTFVSLSFRPLFPIDETRYAAVAWEMWFRDDYLVPHLNGETYSHKPPLLFWLMQLSWWLFGVNDWSLRIIAPLFSLASLYLSQAVAKVLWPDRGNIAQLTPFILLGFFFWMVYGTLTMFDIMLSFFVLLSIYAIALSLRKGLSYKRWLLLALAIGGGVLSKGPIILLHVLPLVLLAPWLLAYEAGGFSKKRWYLGLLSAVLAGVMIALCWAVPAGFAGGEAYRKAIFLGQTSGRIVDSFAHKLPFWWYLQLLPLVLLPWLLVKPFWLGFAYINKQDKGLRFCMVWALPVFIAFSLVSGKRIHYLLPLMPAIALLLAWLFDQATGINWRRANRIIMIILVLCGLLLTSLPWLNGFYTVKIDVSVLSPLWGLALLLIAVLVGFSTPVSVKGFVVNVSVAAIAAALAMAGGFFESQGNRYDTAPPAHKIAELMAENRAIGFFGGKYHGQFHFAGRLTKPIILILDHSALLSFANRNPTGYVLVEFKDREIMPMAVVSYDFPFKNRNVGLIPCQTLLTNPQVASKLFPS